MCACAFKGNLQLDDSLRKIAGYMLLIWTIVTHTHNNKALLLAWAVRSVWDRISCFSIRSIKVDSGKLWDEFWKGLVFSIYGSKSAWIGCSTVGFHQNSCFTTGPCCLRWYSTIVELFRLSELIWETFTDF